MAAASGARGAGPAAPAGTNLWQKLLRDSSVRTKLPVVNFVVVGDHESGKTALLARLDERSGASSTDAGGGSDESSKGAAVAGTGANDTSGISATTATGTNQFTGASSLLSYATMHVLDPKARASGDSDDVLAHINTWTLNELTLAPLVATAVKPHALAHTVVAVVLDLSRPWTIKSALEQWTSALEGQLLTQINQLPVEQRGQLYNAVKQYILAYEDPTIDHSMPTPMELSNKKEFLEEGALAKNLGVPLVIVVAKSDLRPENSVKMDYVEYFLRQFAIKYGAAVFYTSAKTGTNIDLLRNYVLHRVFPTQFKCDHAPQLVERSAIFVPSGYDSFDLVQQSLVGSQPKWPADKPFDKIVPVPAEEADDLTAAAASSSSSTNAPGTPNGGDVKLDAHERWLEKLEKAAGAGLEELQKQSVEASKKAEAAAAARRAAAERRKREEKDVSSTHLANFFNNLLSRPEKSKSGRSLDVKKKDKSEPSVKSLAEQELQNLKRTNGT